MAIGRCWGPNRSAPSAPIHRPAVRAVAVKDLVVLPLIGVDIFIGDCMLPIVDEPLPHGVGLPPLAIDMLLPPRPRRPIRHR